MKSDGYSNPHGDHGSLQFVTLSNIAKIFRGKKNPKGWRFWFLLSSNPVWVAGIISDVSRGYSVKQDLISPRMALALYAEEVPFGRFVKNFSGKD